MAPIFPRRDSLSWGFSRFATYSKMEPEERFLHHSNGSTFWETSMALFPCTLSVALLPFVVPWFIAVSSDGNTFSKILRCIIEFPLLIILPLLNVTVFNEHCESVAVFLISVFVGFLALSYSIKATIPAEQNETKPQANEKVWWKNILAMEQSEDQLPYITNYRSFTYIFTAICILAVDFRVFPRRFAKTQLHGFSVMDIGVGTFVFAQGVVSPEAREHFGKKQASSNLWRAFLSSVPLVVLGFLRLILTTMVHYHRHAVSEYGVHWNFFFTLAVVKLGSSILLLRIPANWSGFVSVALIGIHEYLLQHGLGDWIVDDLPRTDLLTANKEGLGSSLGYLSLHFAGVALGRIFFRKRNIFADLLHFLLIGAFLDIFLLQLVNVFHVFVPTSRRRANFTYWYWMCVFNFTYILILMGIELILQVVSYIRMLDAPYLLQEKTNEGGATKHFIIPALMDAINYNGLLFFLVANVLTGLVNLSINTKDVPNYLSVLILVFYMLLVCLPVVILYIKKIKLKFW